MPTSGGEAELPNTDNSFEEAEGVIVRDDLDALLQCLPPDVRKPLSGHPQRAQLLEIVMDLGRRPEARFLGQAGGEFLMDRDITSEDLEAAERALGEFGGDNRAGIANTLHRISAIRNRRGTIVGLTCRVGRAVTGHVEMIRDLLDTDTPNSILFLGPPGVGKTTVIREIARVLADEMRKRVVIVDTSNEIGGDGDIPHPAIGGARRMQVPDPAQQHKVMVEAVENHMPEVVIIDEIGTEAEATACRTIAERGVTLVGTAHGQVLENLMKNPTLSDLVGGIHTVTLGDEEARQRGTRKSVQERKAPPTFPLLVEIRERSHWVAHWVQDSVDALLQNSCPIVQIRTRDADTKEVLRFARHYDCTEQETYQVASLSTAPADLGFDSMAQDEDFWMDRNLSETDALEELALLGYIGGAGKDAGGKRAGKNGNGPSNGNGKNKRGGKGKAGAARGRGGNR